MAGEIGSREYCKYHNSWKHSTNDCVIFWDVLQDKIDKGILRLLDKDKETTGVDADPFPSMFVGVNVVDLRSIARDRNQPYFRCRVAVDDMRWVIEEARAVKIKLD
ncbi:hypothetical protein SLE2022_212960 [Rubroshorea leprosula]